MTTGGHPGEYRNYYELDGKLLSHTMDPLGRASPSSTAWCR